jgi:rhomboid family GlyGly-CTERM serine protease
MLRRLPWLALLLALAGELPALVPGGGEALQYARERVDRGEAWRLATGQLVHWTPRMALLDLGVGALLAALLEMRGRRTTAAWALLLGGAATAATVHLLLPDLAFYRGSSGLASALFVAAAATAARDAPPMGRALAWTALVLFAVKLLWEAASGSAAAAGALPPGVEVAPLVHLLAGAAGGLACALDARRRPTPREPG